MIICCGMVLKEMGMLGVCVRKMKSTDCEDGDSDTDW